jgi:hypothetical protein
MTTAAAIRNLAAGPDAEVLSGIRRASAASGIDFGYLMAQAAQESGFRKDAKAATSSAAGLFQFVEGTWIDLMRRHGAKHGVAATASRDELLDMRSDPRLSAAMAAEYAKENRAALEGALDRKAGAADLYFAHFLGAGGATRFLQALDAGGSVKAAELMPEAAAANRAVFYDPSGEAKTVQTIYRELSQKIEQQVSAWAQPAAAASAEPRVAGAAMSVQPGFRPPRLSRPMVQMLDALAFSALKLIDRPTPDRQERLRGT